MGRLRMVICCFILVLLASLPRATSSAAEKPDISKTKATTRAEIWKAITGGKTGSAAVAIMDNGAMVYSEGFGAADREKNIPVDRNTVFNISSISKVYCATAVMLLVDEGKIELDKPVTAYLPEFTMADERYKDITVRMLLNHTSGLLGTINPGSGGYEYNADYPATVLATLAKSYLKHNPGEMAVYCNDGFTVAEMVVAKVSGKRYIDFLRERVFKPLALGKSGPAVAQRADEKNLVVARIYNSSGQLEPLEVVSTHGAGGLSATAEDLCRFADSFSTGGRHILSPSAIAEMNKPQPAWFSGKLRQPSTDNGLGWDITGISRFKAQGIKVVGKAGDTQYHSMLLTAPDKRISVAVVTAGPQSVAMEIANTVMETYLAEKGYYVKAVKAVTPPRQAQPIPEDLAVYEGYYSTGTSLLRLELDMQGKTLDIYMVSGGQESKVASAIFNDGYFYAQDAVYYLMSADNRYYLVRFLDTYDLSVVMCQKIEPAAAPQELRVAVDGRQWLRRNVKASDGNNLAATHIITSRSLGDKVAGYIDFFGVKKVESDIVARPAVNALRDLTELRLFDKDGSTWAWVTGLIFMPADEAEVLAGNEAKVSIGSEGYNEWLRLAKNAVLSFEMPAKGRVFVFDGSGKVLYDSVFDSGAVYAPAGSFIEMAANPGSSFKVIASH